MTPDADIPAQDPGKPRAPIDQLFERLYNELRMIARHYMNGERSNHTLQPTALVHEAYMRLVDSGVVIENRVHFLRLAATTMRRVLIDYARKKRALAGGGQYAHVTLEDDMGVVFPNVDMIDFYTALDKLALLDERQAEIIVLRLIIGLTVEEVAAELGVSPRTIKGDTRVARAWLARELE